MRARAVFRSFAALAVLLAGCSGPSLERSVMTGDLQGVRSALDAGADIHRPNAHGITPLMAAARASRPEVAELLIERGARVRDVDKRGFTALHYAAQNGLTGTVGLLLDRGAPVNAMAGTGRYTPLHLAVIDSRDEAAVLLVERGADLEQKNAQGFNALEIAASRRDYELAGALEEAEERR